MNIQEHVARGSTPSLLFIATSLALMACTTQHGQGAGPIEPTTAALGVRDPTHGFFDDTTPPAISSRGVNTLDAFKLGGGLMYQRSVDNGAWAPTWKALPPLQSPHTLQGNPAAVSWDS